MATLGLGDYYNSVGSIFGQAAGGLLGGINSTASSTDTVCMTTTDTAGLYNGLYNYVYQPYKVSQQIGIQQMAQDWQGSGSLAEVAKRTAQEKRKNERPLEMLRSEIKEWCEHVLEV